MHNETKLFLAGIKPALSFYSRRGSEDLKDYPHFRCLNQIVYFQTEDDKEKFVSGWNMLEGIKSQKAYLGYALGYPDLAVEYYTSTSYKERVRIRWNGISFLCHPRDKEYCIRWMNRNYDVPEHLKTDVKFIELRDYVKLTPEERRSVLRMESEKFNEEKAENVVGGFAIAGPQSEGLDGEGVARVLRGILGMDNTNV